MAIEFRCDTCGKLLRTGRENTGRAAKCPGCGQTLAVPSDPPESAAGSVSGSARPNIGRAGRAAAPHRGGLVLAFGILSWATACFLFGVVAWIMAAEDLRAMRAGVMDNSGEPLTRAGMYLGLINVVVFGVGVLIVFTGAGLAFFV